MYPLQFHGEHLPACESRVFLNDSRDAVGMPRLSIDVRFSEADVDGILRPTRSGTSICVPKASGCLSTLTVTSLRRSPTAWAPVFTSPEQPGCLKIRMTVF